MIHFSPSGPQPDSLGGGVVLERLAKALTPERITALALALSVAVALLAPLGPLASNRFHGDEAIYSSWGLDIASGRDLLISGSPVDKPPLFFYVQALSYLFFGPTEVAARLPSLAANVVSVGLIYALGRELYGRDVAVLAAFLWAASPFAILFAPTAFTDPLMVTGVLAGCLAAVLGRWGWGGILVGLGAITKQQGIFFVPLALVLGVISHLMSPTPNVKRQAASFVMAFLGMLGLAFAWDVARAHQPGFLGQSLISYGGLPLSLTTAWEHLLGFGSLLRFATGSPVLNVVFLFGLALLLVLDGLFLLAPSGPNSSRLRPRGQALVDLVLVIFVVLFLVGHSLVAFAVWDRYLLGLVPLLALLLARVLTLPRRLLRNLPFVNLLSLLFVLVMLTFTLRPIRDAAASRFPVGGDHGAYQGIEQVVNYFENVPSDTTLYQRWLGWHWRFYMWGSSYDSPAWTSPEDLAVQAAARPGARRYVVFPSWRSSTEARLALADAGLDMREVGHALRDDGTTSFTIYRIQEAP